MKKKLALLLTLAMACTATACGSPAASTQGTDAVQTDSAKQNGAAEDTGTEEIELEVAYWGDKAEIAMKSALLEQYEKEHPGIKIKQTYTDGGTYQAKIQMWFSSGKAPDVLGIANDLIEPYKDLGVIENLAPYMERDGLLDGNTWEQAAVDSFSFGENIFAAPYVYKSLAIAYNKDLFDEAGPFLPYAGLDGGGDAGSGQEADKGRRTGKTVGNKAWNLSDQFLQKHVRTADLSGRRTENESEG